MNSTSKAELFVFDRYEADWESGKLSFHYEVIKNGARLPFTEHWELPPHQSISHVPEHALHAALQSLHLVVGTSYYKAFCPQKIEIRQYELTCSQADFWNRIYTKGLGEFFYKNQIDYRGLVRFPCSKNEELTAPNLPQQEEKALVLHGGGKDSIVTAEIVRKSETPFDLFCLNPKEIQRDVAKVMDKNIVGITRHIDPKLIELNRSGTIYNGHVPISVMYTFAAVLEALIGGYTYIIISSERSSSYGNVEYLGEEINHQWSKSDEAENMLREYIATHISPDLHYFSMLRPFYEIQVAEKFTKYPQYFEVFSSSNHNFRLDEEGKSHRWELRSPKTLFVYAILSAFLRKAEMQRIFESEAYDVPELLPIFRELLGLADVKPFECVGTPEEMIVAMKMADDLHEYKDSAAMKMLQNEVLPFCGNIEKLRAEVFSKGISTNIPIKFQSLL